MHEKKNNNYMKKLLYTKTSYNWSISINWKNISTISWTRSNMTFVKSCRIIYFSLQNMKLNLKHFFFSSSSLSNCLTSVLKSSSLKKIKNMFKSKRISLTVSTVESKKLSVRAIVLRHEVSRKIIDKRLKEDRTMKDFSKKRQLFSDQKETIILRFVDQFIELRFLFRIYMIEEKIIFLLQKREISNVKLRAHWIKRFLNRHSEYRTKFSRHLDQERHWSSDSTVFVQWFDLVKKTMIKYNIVIDDVYNMNEKKYMMKMSEATQWMFFFDRISRVFETFFVYFKLFNFAFLVYSPHF